MTSKEALVGFEKIIKADSYREEYCSAEIEWIRLRCQDWTSGQLRLGVIGVTSSGKSTLINAILACDLLSSAVVPSSGQLVSCRRGDSHQCIIRFENGQKKLLQGKQLTQCALSQFSDERYNPRNVKKVQSIELVSPSFDLGNDVLLIDSPGLDAFGLEAHEKLTLESLVPTIDACIYVTTMKTNSDFKTKEILDVVAKYDCPVLIIQNMLDSVRASPSGDKTREQVAADHLTRMKRIVSNSKIADKGQVSIMQMSAEQAKHYRAAQTPVQRSVTQVEFSASRYQVFTVKAKEMLTAKRPQIEYQRLRSVLEETTQLLTAIQKKLALPRTKVDAWFQYEDLKKTQSSLQQRTEDQLSRMCQQYQNSANRLRSKADSIQNCLTEANVEQLLKDINVAVSEFATGMADLMSNCTKEIQSAAETLHIPSRDILRPDTIDVYHDVHMQKKTKQVNHRVKDSGFGSGFKRFFADIFNQNWGYHYEPEETVVDDLERSLDLAVTRLQEAGRRYPQTVERWIKNSLIPANKKLLDRIEQEEASYNHRKQMQVEVDKLNKLEKELKDFCNALRQTLDDLSQDPHLKRKLQTDDAKMGRETVQLNLDGYSSAILRLSRSVLREQHKAITQLMVKHIGCQDAAAIIVGWDKSCMDEFYWQAGIRDGTIILNPTAERLRGCSAGKRCFFILVNTTQYGAAENQLNSLALTRVIGPKDQLIWVVQDLYELLNADRSAEGVAEMMEFSRRLKLPDPSAVYLLHENPVYNLGFFMYQADPKLADAPHLIMHEIQTKYGEYSSPEIETVLSDMIREAHRRR